MAQTPAAATLAGAHNTFATLAERAIREMIADGRLIPGTRVNEVELAESLQISRGPLREAIQRLAAQGLLTTRSHRGAYVKAISTEELRDLYDLRTALEVHALRAGAQRAEPKQLEIMAALKEQTRARLESPDSDGHAYDLDFHHRIIELAGNASLAHVHNEVLQQIALARSRASREPGLLIGALEQHLHVLEPLLEGRVDEAAAALATHLDTSCEEAVALLAAAAPASA